MKKPYTKPVVAVFIAEGTTLLSGSGDQTRLSKFNVDVDNERVNPTSVIWGNPDDIDANDNTFGWE